MMGRTAGHELDEFANALQLSIETKIGGIAGEDDKVIISFDPHMRDDDRRLATFLGLFCADGSWRNQKKDFVIGNAAKVNWPKLTLFLLLTRMDEGNILKLAEMDAFAAEIAAGLGLKLLDTQVDSIEKCAKAVSARMAQKKMTIRELADAAGLTQVSISNFRAGKDVRLSSLLRIIKALGMSIRIK